MPKLKKVENWLSECFYVSLKNIVTMHSIELAWDFHNTTLTMQNYERIVLRIAATIFPKSIVNSFTVAIVGNSKRCNYNAKNGAVTAYIQSTKKKGSSQDSSNLKYNANSASSTIIYSKGIAKNEFMRIEHRIDKGKATRNGIIFDPTNFTQIMDLPNLPFSEFFQFKQIDLTQFAQALNPQPGIRGIRRRLWQNMLANSPSMTTADATRLIRLASRCSRELAAAAKRATKMMTMEETINLPLPKDFCIAQRMGRHSLPDDRELPKEIELAPFFHELEAEPVKIQQGKLPISKDMPQNHAESARREAQGENAAINMRRTKFPPKRP